MSAWGWTCFLRAHAPLAALLVAVATTMAGGELTAETKPPQITLDLQDGSRVVGTAITESLPVATSFSQFKLTWAQLRIIRFEGKDSPFTLTLQNGDRVQGTTSQEELRLQTLVGPVSVPVRLIKCVTVGGNLARVSEGLVLWLDARDFTEEKWTDRSGVSGDGVPKNVKRSEEGFPIFNGTDALVRIPKKHEFDAMTLSIWARKSSDHSRTAESIFSCGVDGEFFIDMGGASSSHGIWRGVAFTTGGTPNRAFLKRPFETSWVLFTMSYDGKEMWLYQDGVPCERAAAVGKIIPRGKEYVIGLRNPGQPYFAGNIGEVLLYNRALSDEEIQTIHEAGADRFKEP